MKFSTAKTFPNLPCAHQQWFDKDESNEQFSGSCAKFHGYDRSVTLKIEGEIDEHGWVFPFGHFKEVRKFLEYYFDHTSLISADDPRLEATVKFNDVHKVFNLRVMPSGVSMEQSALFIFMAVNNYIFAVTNGRCVLTEVECREHDKNACSFHADQWEAINFALANFGAPTVEAYRQLTAGREEELIGMASSLLIKEPRWQAQTPAELLEGVKQQMHHGFTE